VKICLLYNADAGKGISPGFLRDALEQAGHTVVHVVQSHSSVGMIPDEVDLVVAAGGDGTVRKAAIAVAGLNLPMAILPLGTANNVARSLGIEGSIPDLIARWDTRRTVRLDLGLARASWGQSPFLEGLGGGLIPAGIASIENDPGDEGGRADEDLSEAARRYEDVLAKLKPHPCIVILDGVRTEEDLLLIEVLNTRAIGPNLVLSEETDPSDGLLSIVAAGEEHRERLASYLQGYSTDVRRKLDLPTRHASHVEIHGWPCMHVDDKIHRSPPDEPIAAQVDVGAVRLLAVD
jgi:diacylglycerol kinase family enzyme